MPSSNGSGERRLKLLTAAAAAARAADTAHRAAAYAVLASHPSRTRALFSKIRQNLEDSSASTGAWPTPAQVAAAGARPGPAAGLSSREVDGVGSPSGHGTKPLVRGGSVAEAVEHSDDIETEDGGSATGGESTGAGTSARSSRRSSEAGEDAVSPAALPAVKSAPLAGPPLGQGASSAGGASDSTAGKDLPAAGVKEGGAAIAAAAAELHLAATWSASVGAAARMDAVAAAIEVVVTARARLRQVGLGSPHPSPLTSPVGWASPDTPRLPPVISRSRQPSAQPTDHDASGAFAAGAAAKADGRRLPSPLSPGSGPALPPCRSPTAPGQAGRRMSLLAAGLAAGGEKGDAETSTTAGAIGTRIGEGLPAGLASRLSVELPDGASSAAAPRLPADGMAEWVARRLRAQSRAFPVVLAHMHADIGRGAAAGGGEGPIGLRGLLSSRGEAGPSWYARPARW